VKEELTPYIDKLRKAVSSGSGKFTAEEVVTLGGIWYRLRAMQLDPSCGYCVMKMCKDLTSWYDLQ
jgi:hypothetical protein